MYVEFENLKHNNRKEIITLQNMIQERKDKRKFDFLKYLYELKTEFLNKEEKAKLHRLSLIKRR